MNLIVKILTKLSCKHIGTDQFGNKYYITRRKDHEGKYKRSVLYNGKVEPSKVPALWHSWLHYTSNEIPIDNHKYVWEKIHLPNLTGTKHAYKPSGHPLSNNKDDLTQYYKPWKP